MKKFIIYTTKTAIARSIDKTDDTVRRMIKDGEIVSVFQVNKAWKEKAIGFVLRKYISE